jgi:hypothetical protein
VEKQYLLLVSALGLDTVSPLAIDRVCLGVSINVRELGSHGCGRVVLSVVFREADNSKSVVARLAHGHDKRKNVGPPQH